MDQYLSINLRVLNSISFLFIFLLFASCEGNKAKEDFDYGLIVYDQERRRDPLHACLLYAGWNT
ncbi:hypothetical protein [Pedobacter sp. NJ-S-72]